MIATCSHFAASCLLALSLRATGAEELLPGADAAEFIPALATDDECGMEANCSLSALQRSLEVRRVKVAAETSRLGTCIGYGCASLYDPMRICQCNPDCRWHDNCCKDFADTCAETMQHASSDERGPIMTLYHQTSPEIGEIILKTGFKPGKRGWCGGAIYFATSPQATITKAAGLNSHHGFMIEAVVSLGKIKHMPPWCDMSMTRETLDEEGYDSIVFNPVDGDEHVVYNSSMVLSTRRFPFDWPR